MAAKQQVRPQALRAATSMDPEIQEKIIKDTKKTVVTKAKR
jgi:hypothetical protein